MRESSILFVMGEAAIDLAIVGKDFERAAMDFPCAFVAIAPLADLSAWEESDDLCLAVCRVEDKYEPSIIQQELPQRATFEPPLQRAAQPSKEPEQQHSTDPANNVDCNRAGSGCGIEQFSNTRHLYLPPNAARERRAKAARSADVASPTRSAC